MPACGPRRSHCSDELGCKRCGTSRSRRADAVQNLCGAELGFGARARLCTTRRRTEAAQSFLRLSADDAGMLNAMLFGDRAGLNKTQRVGFERTGSFHLFVVSGMHVGLLAGLVFWLTRTTEAAASGWRHF